MQVMVSSQLLRSLITLSQDSLKSAWNDMASEGHRWAIIKAWTAARDALNLAVVGLARSAPEDSNLSMLMPILFRVCRGVRQHDIMLLEFLYRSVTDLSLYSILYQIGLGPRKADALEAIEASLRLVNAAKNCISMKIEKIPPFFEAPLGALRRSVSSYRGGEITVVMVGRMLYMIMPEMPLLASERISIAVNDLKVPPGFIVIPLSADEAYGYLNLAWSSFQEVEIVRDDLGMGALFQRKQDSNRKNEIWTSWDTD